VTSLALVQHRPIDAGPRPQARAQPRSARAPLFIRGAFAFSLVVVQFPFLFGSETATIVQLAVPAFFGCLGIFIVGGFRGAHPPTALTVVGLLALLTVAILRAGYPSTVQGALLSAGTVLAVATFAAAWLAGPGSGRARDEVRSALCAAPVVYVATNVCLWLVGVESNTTLDRAPTEFGWLLGLDQRVVFPLGGGGINNFGVITGAALTSSLIFLRRGHHRRWGVLGLLVSEGAIIAVDSRAAFAAALIATGLVLLLTHRRRSEVLPWLALSIPVSSYLVTLGVTAIAPFVGESLSRQAGDFATGTSRFQLWDIVTSYLAQFQWVHLVGFGINGQRSSDLSSNYLSLFREYKSPDLNSLHNAGFQYIIDTGYIGLGIVVLVMFVCLRRLVIAQSREQSASTTALLALLVYCCFVGWTDAAPTIFGRELFMLWLMVLIAAVFTNQKRRSPGTKAGSGP